MNKLLTYLDFNADEIIQLDLLYKRGFISYPRANTYLLSNDIFDNRKKILEDVMLVNKHDFEFITNICSKVNLNYKNPLFSGEDSPAQQPLMPLGNGVFIPYYDENFIFNEHLFMYYDVYKKVRDNFFKIFIEP